MDNKAHAQVYQLSRASTLCLPALVREALSWGHRGMAENQRWGPCSLVEMSHKPF